MGLPARFGFFYYQIFAYNLFSQQRTVYFQFLYKAILRSFYRILLTGLLYRTFFHFTDIEQISFSFNKQCGFSP